MARAKHFSNNPASRSGKRLRSSKTQPSPPQQSDQETPSAPSPPASGHNEAGSSARPRRPHRFKPGTVALREIRKLQKTWHHLIPAAPFIRLVKEVTNLYSREVTRWAAEALVVLQEATECALVELFEDANLCAIHAKRVTIRNSTRNSNTDIAQLSIDGNSDYAFEKRYRASATDQREKALVR